MKLNGYQFLGAPIEFRDRDSLTDDPIILMVKDGKYVQYDPSAFK